jgi:hypothetical protein
MADLTDTEEKLYAREITAILVQYADEMKANDVDASQRIANLDNGSKATDAAETAQAKTDAANNDAIALVAQLRTANYKLAAASVSLIEGALGKDHPGTVKARGLRGAIVGAGPRTPAQPPPPPAPAAAAAGH